MKKKPRGYMAREIYDIIKRKIITLELKPGEHISEKQLENELGTGRTPIREAILMLKAENLLDSQPNQAPYIKDITLKDVRDFFVAFIEIDKFVMKLAAQKASVQKMESIIETNSTFAFIHIFSSFYHKSLIPTQLFTFHLNISEFRTDSPPPKIFQKIFTCL